MRRRLSAALILMAAAVTGGGAHAHSALEKATPRQGSVLTAPPSQVRLQFSQRIEAGLVKVEVHTEQGEAILADAPQVSTKAGKVIVEMALPALPPGRYSVIWRAVSVDTHATDGTVRFEIRRP